MKTGFNPRPAIQQTAIQPRPVTGQLYGAQSTALSSVFAANVLYLWPIIFDYDTIIDRLVFFNASAVAGTAKMALFDSLPDTGLPGSLIVESNADVTTNVGIATQLCTLPANQRVAIGRKWAGICFSAAAQAYAATGPGTAGVAWLQKLGGTQLHPAQGNIQIMRVAGLTYVAGPTPFMPATVGAISILDAVPPTPILGYRAG